MPSPLMPPAPNEGSQDLFRRLLELVRQRSIGENGLSIGMMPVEPAGGGRSTWMSGKPVPPLPEGQSGAIGGRGYIRALAKDFAGSAGINGGTNLPIPAPPAPPGRVKQVGEYKLPTLTKSDIQHDSLQAQRGFPHRDENRNILLRKAIEGRMSPEDAAWAYPKPARVDPNDPIKVLPDPPSAAEEELAIVRALARYFQGKY